MEQTERIFNCPYCWEPISMLLDASTPGAQSYVEDCENCCNPILISYTSEADEVVSFGAERAQ